MKNIAKNLIFSVLIVLGFSLLGIMPAQAQTTLGSNIPGCHWGSCNDSSSNNSSNSIVYVYPSPQTSVTQATSVQTVNMGNTATNIATQISTNSALLNGTFDGTIYSNTTAWFEYGQSTALGQTTEIQNLTTTNFSKVLNGLNSGTIYYFRAVVQNQLGVRRGDIIILKTNDIVSEISNIIPTTTTTTTNVIPDPAPIKIAAPSVVSSNIITLKIENKFENLSRGESADYSISYKNISGQEVNDLILNISLPKDISFEKSDKGNYSDSDHSIILQVTLKAGEESMLQFNGKVDSNAVGKDPLITSVIGVYTNPISKVKENVTAYTLNKIKDGNSLAAASILGNGSFLPDSLIKWIFLTVLIFGLIYLGRMFYKSKEDHEIMPTPEDEEEIPEAQAVKPASENIPTPPDQNKN